MWDKAEIRIPFHSVHVMEGQMTKDGKPTGCVDVRLYDYPAHCSVAFIDGEAVYEPAKAQTWETVSSSISNIATAFHPQGHGLYPWPHVLLKASPSKILQGHNVFGTENIEQGVLQMLATFRQRFPKVYQHLDIDQAEIRQVDSTYSAFQPSEYQREKVISLFFNMFDNREAISRHKGYIQGNKHSEYRRQKIYYKLQELQADFEDAKKKGLKEKAHILGNSALHDFAAGRLRFEATTCHRAMDEQGIPRNLFQFVKFSKWFEAVHKQPLCQYLWHKAFDKYLAQLEGHTMKNVDDDSIKLKIQMKFDVAKTSLKTGKTSICRRKSNAIWRTYRQIKTEGYSQLAKEDNSTFHRNVNHLIDAGISRAFLKSLDPQKPYENVVAFVDVIKIDFSNQRPSWYEEPTAGFADPARLLRGQRPNLRVVA